MSLESATSAQHIAHQADLSSVSDIYLNQCAGEAIHRLGIVQPYGFMLVVDLASLRMRPA
jgi:light-regulated signal transduction histidine kinase (bacteriophytochrome)